jgi:kumamolisin
MVRKSVSFSLAIAALVSIVTINSQAQSVLTHHVREVTLNGQAQSLGRLPANQIMQLDVVLPLSDQAGLDAFLKDLYDPSSPSYHQYLKVKQFTDRFGPTQEEYDAVIRFVNANGFTVVGGTRDGMDVQIKGPVSSVEKAFHLSMHTYQHPAENRTFYAPDSEPTTSLTFPLWHISGLDNYSIPHPLLVDKKTYAQEHGINADAVVSHATTGSGPSASFLGSDMRAAYYGGTTLTGAGQNLGLLEYLGTDLADLNTYFANVGQTNNVPITLFSTDGTSTSCLYTRAGVGQPGDVHRFLRYGHHQRHDNTQPSAHHHQLFMGLDAGRSNHAEPILREDGDARPELLCGLRRRLHLESERRCIRLAGRQCLYRFRRRNGPGYRQCGWRLEV